MELQARGVSTLVAATVIVAVAAASILLVYYAVSGAVERFSSRPAGVRVVYYTAARLSENAVEARAVLENPSPRTVTVAFCGCGVYTSSGDYVPLNCTGPSRVDIGPGETVELVYTLYNVSGNLAPGAAALCLTYGGGETRLLYPYR